MSNEKSKKKKTKTIATIDKKIARALFLTKAKTSSRYPISNVYFNSETKELVATDGKSMLIVVIKPIGILVETCRLETGLYTILENKLLRSDNQNKTFPKYQDMIPKAKEICSGEALFGIIDCMIKNKVYINIWRFGTVLKILNKISQYGWVFTNESPNHPVMMEFEDDSYQIKYIMMYYRGF